MIYLQKSSPRDLISTYNQMIHEMHRLFEQSGSKDMSLPKSIELASKKILREHSACNEDIEEISAFIRHDINDAAEYMMENRDDFFDWLSQDIDVIEHQIIKTFLSVADQTRIEVERIR